MVSKKGLLREITRTPLPASHSMIRDLSMRLGPWSVVSGPLCVGCCPLSMVNCPWRGGALEGAMDNWLWPLDIPPFDVVFPHPDRAVRRLVGRAVDQGARVRAGGEFDRRRGGVAGGWVS